MGYQNNIKEYERILKLYSNDIYRMALLKLKMSVKLKMSFRMFSLSYTHAATTLNQICT